MGTYIVELDDVGVAHLFQNGDFTVDALQVGMVLNLLLLQDLDSHLPNQDIPVRSHINKEKRQR